MDVTEIVRTFAGVMYEQEFQENLLFMLLYGAAAMLSLTACCYLLFRRANAIAPDIMSPVRLRRWTAAFFASMTLSHVWYLPIAFLTSREGVLMGYLVGAVLDFMTLIPLAIVVLLAMLQDRRRPLWPACLMLSPVVMGMVWCLANHSDALVPVLYVYFLLLGIGFIIYMVRATRQYGRWLRDNYADLEHKEVWQSFVVLAVIMLVFGIYSFSSKGMAYLYVQQMNDIIMICYLLWRVETLSDLRISQSQDLPIEAEDDSLAIQTDTTEDMDDKNSPLSIRNRSVSPLGLSKNIEPLLKQHCIDTQLYLQHDLTLLQLAKAIGINRFYLSQYFSSQGMSYNAYINNLRINHFVSIYREAVATQSSFTVQQLALKSGFRSYTTFSTAFKYKMGQSARSWMKSASKA